jgi:hypothetical protein
MANLKGNRKVASPKKKTSQGLGKYSKFGNKGGGPGGSTTGKTYRKKYRGQGK